MLATEHVIFDGPGTPMSWSRTLAGKVVPAEVASVSKSDQYSYRVCTSFVIKNGDKCSVGNWVLARRPGRYDTFVAKVTEILQIVSIHSGTEPSFVLVQIGSFSNQPNTYHMPSVVASQGYALVQYDVSLHFNINPQQSTDHTSCIRVSSALLAHLITVQPTHATLPISTQYTGKGKTPTKHGQESDIAIPRTLS